ncbi:hypothetical protein HPB50_005321 [Hyalomma asiaticum]|uniref:Uncharacterized protein n=1 Tax=Hyalomma asiaticum TaxID=266040 RepID=A0ACB7RTB2_HYAAI|nr:hypothetical protein HPB50_005321 [Hyalomma asiaticum]
MQLKPEPISQKKRKPEPKPTTSELLRELFLQRISQTIRLVLAVAADVNLDRLAELADHVHEATARSVNAVSPPADTAISALRPASMNSPLQFPHPTGTLVASFGSSSSSTHTRSSESQPSFSLLVPPAFPTTSHELLPVSGTLSQTHHRGAAATKRQYASVSRVRCRQSARQVSSKHTSMAPVGAAFYSATEQDGKDYWLSQWKEGGATWQQQGVTKLLKDNKDVVLAGKTRAQVFIPLCGKAHELKWFLDLGHNVVGVEFIEDCVREYFAESGLQLQEETCPVIGCTVLQTPDRRLRVFICSIYDFRRDCAGPMDIVWDRSGFSAIPEEDRPRYTAVLKSLLAPGFSYGMWTISYDAPWYKWDIVKPILVDSYVVEKEDFLNGTGPVTYSLWHMTS